MQAFHKHMHATSHTVTDNRLRNDNINASTCNMVKLQYWRKEVAMQLDCQVPWIHCLSVEMQ